MYRKFIKLIFTSALVILSYSIIKSGLYYMYDIDEFSHSQYIYLLAHGGVPYISFFYTYFPLFHWFLVPFYKISGFNFEALQTARIIMMILYFIRVALGYLITRKLFGARVAAFFIPLFLLDAFGVFSGMQIRPDNLMMTVYLVGLYIFIHGILRNSGKIIFISGLIISLSTIILLKIIPSVAALPVIFTLIYYKKKKTLKIFAFWLGLILPWSATFLYFWATGMLMPIIRNVFIFRLALDGAILNPMPRIFFFSPNNPNLFGSWGVPLTLVYAWIFPFLALLGVSLVVINTFFRKRDGASQSYLKILFAASLCLQTVWLLIVRGFFVQYFLTVSFYWAMFGAIFLSALYIYLKNKFVGKFRFDAVTFLYLLIFLIFAYVSIRANMFRSAQNSNDEIAKQQHIWQIVGKDEKTFPNILFRPISYPLAVGTYIGDIPRVILRWYGPIYKSLEKDNVRFVFMDSYGFKFLDKPTQDYITANYQKNDEGIYVRIQ